MSNGKWLAFGLLLLLAGILWSCGNDPSPPASASRFVFVANTEEDSISAFTINQSTGALTLFKNMSSGSAPTDIVLHPNGRYLVVANSDAHGGSWGGSGTVSVFSYNSSTGGLSNVTGSPFAARTMALNAAIDPTGKYLYVTNQNDFQLTTFLFDGSTGGLTEASFSPLDEHEAHSIVMHPTGKYFYVGSESGEIHGHMIRPTFGSYSSTPNSPYLDAGGANNWLSVTPDGKHLYAMDANSAAVTGFSVNATTGELSLLAGFPFSVPTATTIKSSAITPNGTFLYLAYWDTGEIGAYRISSTDGSLTAVTNMPFAAGTNPKSISIDRRGRFLYVANYGSSDVSAYTINAVSGELTLVGTYPTGYAAGAGPKMILAVP